MARFTFRCGDNDGVNPVNNTTYTDWQPITRSMRDDIVDAIDAALGSSSWQSGGGMFTQTQTDYSETNSNDDSFLVNRQLIAPLASPDLTGQPTAPTPGNNNDSTRLANTAWVRDRIGPLAPLASPALTGNPTAPTQNSGNNSTRLATTAFVEDATSGLVQRVLNGTRRPTSSDGVDGNLWVRTDQYHDIYIKAFNGSWLNQG